MPDQNHDQMVEQSVVVKYLCKRFDMFEIFIKEEIKELKNDREECRKQCDAGINSAKEIALDAKAQTGVIKTVGGVIVTGLSLAIAWFKISK